MRSHWMPLLVVLGTAGFVHGQTPAPPSFSRQVLPFFTRYCVECHNSQVNEGGLNLEGYKALMEGGQHGPSLEPGKPDTSRLIRMMEGKLKPVMPPAKSRQPKPQEVAEVRAWVLAGARFDGAAVRPSLARIVPRRQVPTPVTAVAYSADGKMLAAAGRGEVLVLASASGEVVARIPAGQDRVTALAYAPRSSLLAMAASTAGKGHEVRIVAGQGTPSLTLQHDDVIQALAFSPDGRYLASASYDRLIKIWDLAAAKEYRILRDHSDAVYGLSFSPDSKLLASGGADRAVKVWDVATGERLYTLGESTDWVYAVAWSPDGKHLAAAGVDRSIRVWAVDARGGRVAHSVFAHEKPVLRLAYSGDGQTLFSLGEDQTVKIWDAVRMTERRVLPRQPESALSLAVRFDQKEIAVGRFDGVLVVLDSVTGKTLRQPLPAPPPVPGDLFPLVEEREPNHSPGSGQLVKPPVTVSGVLDRAGDLDWYRLEIKAGEEIGVRLRSSKTDLLLRLVDPLGVTVAESRSGLLGHVCQAAGTYSLGVRDREFRGGPDFTYRLSIGSIPVINSVYPLGGRPGEKVEVQLRGANLGPTRSVRVSIPLSATPGSRVDVPVPPGVLGKHSLVVGEFPEVLAASGTGTLSIPGTGNGVIEKPGELNTWRFTAKKGQRLILEVSAARLGSALDSVIEIHDRGNQPIPRAALRCLARSYVTFRDHDSQTPAIRLDTWSELNVNDWVLLGNELLRIKALPLNPDDNCRFFEDRGQRQGFLGTTPTHQSQGTPLYKVSLHPPGTIFPPNGLPVTTVYWRNDDGGAGQGKDSRLVFDPPQDGEYLLRVGDTRGEGGPNHAYRVTVREPRPDFTVSLNVPGQVTKGSGVPVRIVANRVDEFDGPIELQLKGLPPGFSAPPTQIPAGETRTALALFAEANAVAPTGPVTLTLEARAVLQGKETVRSALGTLPKLLDREDIVASTAEKEVVLQPGGETRVRVRIDRHNKFNGRVPIEIDGLPHGVRVLDIGLNGILITPTETERTIVLTSEPWVEPMNHPFVVFARREGTGKEYAARSILLRVAR
ncbi:MAG: c-type cytochrome domain-containing protein [Gemmataceae bacterium]